MSDSQPRTENLGAEANVKAGLPPQPTPAVEPAPADLKIAYQPISGWAIAGFATGSLFAILVAISTIVALAQGAPMFIPAWILALAFLGIVLSLIGQKQIQDSEGTRAGAKLARLGIWLSLVSGLGYLSYFYVTGLALQAQANAFAMEKGDDAGFFPRLREGADNPAQLNAAFLLTLPATARSGRPEDEAGMKGLHDIPSKDGAPGALTQFKEGGLARLFSGHLAKDAEITPLGVQDWKYEMHSYKIYRNYRVKTKELEVEVQLAVFSTEAESAGKERKWFVNMRESTPLYRTLTPTPTGNGIKLLRHLAQLWLRRDMEQLNEGKAFPEIKDLDQSNWNQVFVRDGNRDAIKKFVHERFASQDKNRIQPFNVMSGREDIGKWEIRGGKVRIYHNFRSMLRDPASGAVFNADGYAILDTKGPVDPAQFTELTVPLPEWDVVSIVFTQVTASVLGGPKG